MLYICNQRQLIFQNKLGMKKLLLLAVITVFGVSCISKDFENMKLDLEHLDPFTEKTAPIKEGYVTIIKADGEAICKSNIEYNYLFPKGSIETIEYIPLQKNVVFGTWTKNQYTACFEDTRNGDNDYNDFVCYITMETGDYDDDKKGRKDDDLIYTNVYIQPIAYGAGTVLRFGIRLPNGQDTIISNNILQDFFPGIPPKSYVNTVKANSIYQTNNINSVKKFTYIQTENSNLAKKFHPFIINEQGEKLFLALNFTNNGNNNYLEVVGVTGYPLGIATKGKFDYPAEKINISSCYSGFNPWVMGNSSQIGSITGIANNVFIISNNGNGSSGISINSNPKNLFN